MSSELHVIMFFCTDRGQHIPVGIGYSPAERPRLIHGMDVLPGIEGVDGSAYPEGAVLSRGAGPLSERHLRDSGLGGMVYTLLCHECGRNPQRKMDALEEIIDGLDAAGFTEVDISRLPF